MWRGLVIAVLLAGVACAGSFEGDGDDFCVVPNHASLSNTNEYSATAWMYWGGDTVNPQHILRKRDGSVGPLWRLLGGTNTVYHTAYVVSDWVPPSNTWIHTGITFDGANVMFYTNGALQATVGSVAKPGNDTSGVNIGGDSSTGFRGMLSDVRLYTNGLSAAQHAAIYAARGADSPHVNDGSNTGIAGRWLGWGSWHPTGESIFDVRDTSGAENHGTNMPNSATGPTWIEKGRTHGSGAVDFSSSAQYLMFADSPFDTAGTNVSFMMWVWMDTVAAAQVIYDKGANGLQCVVGAATGLSVGKCNVSYTARQGTGTLTNNTWYHLAFVHAVSSNSCAVYIDGTNVTTLRTAQVLEGTSVGPTIGRKFDGNYPLDGKIDSAVWGIGIWTQEQITNHYFSGQIPSGATLVLGFDRPEFRAFDISGQGNHGYRGGAPEAGEEAPIGEGGDAELPEEE